MPVQSDGAEPLAAESGDSAEDTVSTQLHRDAGDEGRTDGRTAGEQGWAGSSSVLRREDSKRHGQG